MVDLEARFKDTPDRKDYFFYDHFHPSLKGAEFIAQGLQRHGAQNGFSR